MKALTLTPLWRLIVSLNDESERALVLPPIDQDIADKIMLFKVETHPMPMPTTTPAEKTAFWAALLAELPMLVHHLDNFVIPEELHCSRYGVTHYHHRDLLDQLCDMAPEHHLAELINETIFKCNAHTQWEGTALDLEMELTRDRNKYGAKAHRILAHPNSCATYLGRLSRKRESNISRHMNSGTTIWTIVNPNRDKKQDESPRPTWAELTKAAKEKASRMRNS